MKTGSTVKTTMEDQPESDSTSIPPSSSLFLALPIPLLVKLQQHSDGNRSELMQSKMNRNPKGKVKQRRRENGTQHNASQQGNKNRTRKSDGEETVKKRNERKRIQMIRNEPLLSLSLCTHQTTSQQNPIPFCLFCLPPPTSTSPPPHLHTSLLHSPSASLSPFV